MDVCEVLVGVCDFKVCFEDVKEGVNFFELRFVFGCCEFYEGRYKFDVEVVVFGVVGDVGFGGDGLFVGGGVV